MNAHVIASALLSVALLQAADPPRPLAAGDAVPNVTLRTEEDREVSLRELVAAKTTVLIFYRGGWCPFCIRHLSELAGIEKDPEAASGRPHHLLPHTAVFVADTGGQIRFAHVNPDYTVRREAQKLLAAAKAAVC